MSADERKAEPETCVLRYAHITRSAYAKWLVHYTESISDFRDRFQNATVRKSRAGSELWYLEMGWFRFVFTPRIDKGTGRFFLVDVIPLASAEASEPQEGAR